MNYGPQEPQQPGQGWPAYQSTQRWQPPMHPGYPAPIMPPPGKKKINCQRVGCIAAVVAVLFLAVLIGGGIFAYNVLLPTGSTAGPIPANTHTSIKTTPTQSHVLTAKPTKLAPSDPTWHTVQTFTGVGAKKTGLFTVGNDWRIEWKCIAISGGDAPVYLGAYHSDGSELDSNAVSTSCKLGNTSGDSEEHQGGNIYLDINVGADLSWTIVIQTLK